MTDPNENGIARARAALKGWLEWNERVGAGAHFNDERVNIMLANIVSAYADSLRPDDEGWFSMASYPVGNRAQFYLAEGEKGNGEIAIGMAFPNERGEFDSYWTWGGPNSGSDIYEVPLMWRPLPDFPKQQT